MRIIFITGKGGVGKSTIACALALKFSSEGEKTLIASTDQVHSLTDIFGKKIGNKITKVRGTLEALEIDGCEETRKYFGKFLEFSSRVLEKEGFSRADAEEMVLFPGAEELSCLLRIYEIYLTRNYDIMIVDTASSSETLKLLKTPSVVKNFLKKLTSSTSGLMEKFVSLVEKIFSLNLPKNEFYLSLLKVSEELESARRIFSDPYISRFRIVCTPEKVVFRETERLSSYMAFLGFPVDEIFLNRFNPLREKFLKEGMTKFNPLKIFLIPDAEREPCGLKELEHFSDLYFKNYTGNFGEKYLSIELEERDNFIILSIPAGGIKKEDMEIYSDYDSLFIKMREVSREIKLPHSLTGRPVEKASFKEDRLLVYFKKEEVNFGKREGKFEEGS